MSSNRTYPRFSFEVVTVNPQGKIIDRREASAAYQTIRTLDMVLVPGGTFWMGSPNSEPDRSSDEGPQHQVTVAEFWMSKYPVTRAQWRSVADLAKVKLDLDPNPSRFKGLFKGASCPVDNVTWYEAMEFCARLSDYRGRPYTLPSEAQWEYACRAGTTTPFHFGETITTDLANYKGTGFWGSDVKLGGTTYPGFYGSGPMGVSRGRSTQVGSFPPNGFGLYDMHGNVWEWCLDHYHDNYGGWFRTAPTDGSAWVTGGDSNRRILRGGSWGDDPRNCRCAYRYYGDPDYRNIDIGFRVVSVPPRALG